MRYIKQTKEKFVAFYKFLEIRRNILEVRTDFRSEFEW